MAACFQPAQLRALADAIRQLLDPRTRTGHGTGLPRSPAKAVLRASSRSAHGHLSTGSIRQKLSPHVRRPADRILALNALTSRRRPSFGEAQCLRQAERFALSIPPALSRAVPFPCPHDLRIRPHRRRDHRQTRRHVLDDLEPAFPPRPPIIRRRRIPDVAAPTLRLLHQTTMECARPAASPSPAIDRRS